MVIPVKYMRVLVKKNGGMGVNFPMRSENRKNSVLSYTLNLRLIGFF